MNTDYETRFWEEYKSLGGKFKTRETYEKYSKLFVKHTYNSAMGGDCLENKNDEPEVQSDGNWIYYNMADAIQGFKKASKLTMKEVGIIFESIDNVCSYT